MNKQLLRRYCSEALERFPSIYVRTMRWRLRSKPAVRKVLHPGSALVIEGFPRSSNSFAVKAFRYSNDPDRKLSVATHLHSPAHVLAGLKLKIPTLVLVRDPDEAVPSLMALGEQLRKNVDYERERVAQERMVRYWTGYYARFYERLIPLRGKFVIGYFSEVTTDFNRCISKLNALYGTQFKPFEHTPEAVHEIFESAKVHLSPSEERERLKAAYKKAYLSEANALARQRAGRVYREFLDKGVDHG